MRALEFVQENKQATAQQVLSYIDQTHHQKLIPKLIDAVLAHSRWELRQVPLQNLYIPDQDYQDSEQEPPRDPYDRVMAVDPDHANEYSTKIIDKRPIVIDDQGYIIDGNHRAWAAAELMNRDSIPAWVPVKQSMAEGYRRKLNFDEIYGKYLKVTDNDGDPNKEGFSLVTPLNGNSWNWRERPEFKAIVKRKLNQPGWLGDHKYQQIVDAMSGQQFDPKRHLATENFADGKKPGRKGLSKRVGIPKKASLTQLQKIASSSTGERRRMAQWQLNMRRGKAKKK
jgi:hypothetical protein